jgi:hypothetical protein
VSGRILSKRMKARSVNCPFTGLLRELQAASVTSRAASPVQHGGCQKLFWTRVKYTKRSPLFLLSPRNPTRSLEWATTRLPRYGLLCPTPGRRPIPPLRSVESEMPPGKVAELAATYSSYREAREPN